MDAGARISTSWRKVVRWSLSDGVPVRSLKVALIVGVILNIINQGDAMISEVPLHWPKLVLTFFVPYFVSTYGAVSFRLNTEGRYAPKTDA